MEMQAELKFPKTEHEAIKYFADAKVAHAFVALLRWPGGIVCPRCNGKDHSFIRADSRWHCKNCKKRFSVKTGTIMESSPLSLETWLMGMWHVANTKNGISSHHLHRALGITQKSAWYLSHRIRELMKSNSIEKLSGIVEADEAFIGGKEKFKHKHKRQNAGRGAVGKAVAMGMLQRDGEVRVKHIKNTKKATVQGEVRSNVEPGSKIFTDSLPSYKGLEDTFVHEAVNHVVEFVRGAVHTNRLEGFWCLFKRCFTGTWTHLDDQHLVSYLDEEVWRYNNRKDSDGGRFAIVVASIPGKHLSYETLIERGLETLAPKK